LCEFWSTLLGLVSFFKLLVYDAAGWGYRYAQAADVVSQRIKSITMAKEDKNWDASRYLELVPDEDKTVVIKQSDLRMCRKEQELQNRLNPSGKGSGNAGAGSYQWVPNNPAPFVPQGSPRLNGRLVCRLKLAISKSQFQWKLRRTSASAPQTFSKFLFL
jgi:hypothetical protein